MVPITLFPGNSRWTTPTWTRGLHDTRCMVMLIARRAHSKKDGWYYRTGHLLLWLYDGISASTWRSVLSAPFLSRWLFIIAWSTMVDERLLRIQIETDAKTRTTACCVICPILAMRRDPVRHNTAVRYARIRYNYVAVHGDTAVLLYTAVRIRKHIQMSLVY